MKEVQKPYLTENWDDERKVDDVYENLDKRIIDFHRNPFDECAKYGIKHPASLAAKEKEEKRK